MTTVGNNLWNKGKQELKSALLMIYLVRKKSKLDHAVYSVWELLDGALQCNTFHVQSVLEADKFLNTQVNDVYDFNESTFRGENTLEELEKTFLQDLSLVLILKSVNYQDLPEDCRMTSMYREVPRHLFEEAWYHQVQEGLHNTRCLACMAGARAKAGIEVPRWAATGKDWKWISLDEFWLPCTHWVQWLRAHVRRNFWIFYACTKWSSNQPVICPGFHKFVEYLEQDTMTLVNFKERLCRYSLEFCVRWSLVFTTSWSS